MFVRLSDTCFECQENFWKIPDRSDHVISVKRSMVGCVSFLKFKSGFLIRKRMWILWIISKTGYFGYMLRRVSLLRMWIQPAVTRNNLILIHTAAVWQHSSSLRPYLKSGHGLKDWFYPLYRSLRSLQQIEWQKDYPMDFYVNASLGSWTVNNEVSRQATVSRRRKHLQTEKLTSEEKGANVESKDDCGGERGDCCGKCHQENSQKLNKTEKIHQ